MLASMFLHSLNIALAEPRAYRDREVLTGQHKLPVDQAQLHAETLAGDSVGDRVNHGGPDKAVNVYAFDHYDYWSNVFGTPLSPGAFSENFTVRGALETVVCIGDRWRVGDAVLEVSQPRMPCFKLALKHDKKHLVKWVRETGYTGFYLRTITPGLIRPGLNIDVIARDPHAVCIADINAIYYSRGTADADAIRRALEVPALSDSAREIVLARIKGPLFDA
jgi:MOSC domain-containing protein YiiM